MSMIRETWSISRLAKELGKDRRTMAKELDGLPPAEEREIGGRIEKRWHLEDVIRHLGRRSAAQTPDNSVADFVKDFVGKKLYPTLLKGEFSNGLVGYASKELALSKQQALDLLCATSLLILCGIQECFDDEEMNFATPESGLIVEWLAAKREGRREAFIAETWPGPSKRKSA